MYNNALRLLVSTAALANAQSLAQGPAPPEVLLSATQSGVLPVLPTATPFTGVETIEGAIVFDGPSNPGFTGQLGDAVVQQNTAGGSFMATLPSTNFDPYTGSTITGSLMATVPSNGTGMMVTVNFSGFPAEAQYGPFVYHIHGLPVPADGNCTVTMGHLDPTDRGEYYPCDNTQPQTCQTGDLAGKHGNITGTSFTASYLDLYLSSDPSSAYYIGDKSIVVHSTNTTRLTCANFAAVVSNGTTNGTTTSPTAPANITRPSTTAAATSAVYTGAADKLTIGGVVLGGAFLMAFSML
ncbi:hypothetical protein AMS68_006140 [Peltaster fructicola]|uniref:superoxide dismutase n=1 Tax=Peltaster fructicola TaxID=286661 RepID=A0A6H0Y0T5_9PEZI|nr:hypothetical protein AMS68_006140 [Peltaster fructicola]